MTGADTPEAADPESGQPWLERPAVKVCGLTRPEDAQRAEALGAAYLGVILAGGPRLVTTAQAAKVLGPPRRGVRRVAVFGAQGADEVARVRDTLRLDVVQLHGPATPETVAWLRAGGEAAAWPVVRVAGAALPPEAVDLAAAAGVLVLDALVPGQLGGTGVPLDWPALAAAVGALRSSVPGVQMVVAGGLRPGNVRAMCRVLLPEVVDVSSGVEVSPGIKDPARLAQFLSEARDP
ncbi:MAG: N-(5-phosphoribosyl)anthranilate isomerase [Gemmatimonadota bacterium]